MLALASTVPDKTKPIAMAEVGAAPTADVLTAQPRWTYFMVWSNLVDVSNTVASLNAIYHAPHLLGRDDKPIALPMASLRSATAAREDGKPGQQPVTPDANASVKALLDRLNRATGHATQLGQQNTPQAVAAATGAVTGLTGKAPAIYGEELAITSEMAVDAAKARAAIVEEAERQSAGHAIVSLSWGPARPTDDEPASEAKSVRGQLTDFEWSELLTPGTRLHERWCGQVDEVAGTLKLLQDKGIAVLWQPYPEANGKAFWWAGRKGERGSAALYRQLFDRIVNHDGVHNLVWVWGAAAPAFGPNGPAPLSDFFPGLNTVDALAVHVDSVSGRFRADAMLERLGVGKPIGLEVSEKVPAAALFAQPSNWAWLEVSAGAAQASDQADALRALYGDARMATAAPR
jgi:mannan endo-1,4-beta-mannosidase